MLKKLIPRKEDEATRKKMAISKMIFLGIIATSILLAHLLLQMRKDNATPATSQAPASLGAATQSQQATLQNQINTGVAQLKDSTEYLRQQLEASTEKAVTDGKQQVEEVANRLFYDTTLKPLLDKINTLPPQQQEYIKKQLCPSQ